MTLLGFFTIDHAGLPVNIDPNTGFEIARTQDQSLIALYEETLPAALEAHRKAANGHSVLPPNGQTVIRGYVNDYYIVRSPD